MRKIEAPEEYDPKDYSCYECDNCALKKRLSKDNTITKYFFCNSFRQELKSFKSCEDFGLQPLSHLPKKFEDFYLFRRGIVFAQRDFKQIAESIENKQPFVMMTGLMPSGRFHFGHKLVADQIIFYQHLGARVYIAVADIEAYTSRDTNMG